MAGRGVQGRRTGRLASALSSRRCRSSMSSVAGVRHPGLALTPRIHRLSRHRLRALLMPADQPRRDGGAHARQQSRSGRRRVARVSISRCRYTVDKTTREVLFLPLPSSCKYKAQAVCRRRPSTGCRARPRRAVMLVLIQAVGPRARVVSAQLRQPRPGHPLDLHGVSRASANTWRSFRRSLATACQGGGAAPERSPTSRRSKRWCRSWRTRIRCASSTPSTSSSRSTSGIS